MFVCRFGNGKGEERKGGEWAEVILGLSQDCAVYRCCAVLCAMLCCAYLMDNLGSWLVTAGWILSRLIVDEVLVAVLNKSDPGSLETRGRRHSVAWRLFCVVSGCCSVMGQRSIAQYTNLKAVAKVVARSSVVVQMDEADMYTT